MASPVGHMRRGRSRSPAAAITAAAGIALIGAFVYYAGLGHKQMES